MSVITWADGFGRWHAAVPGTCHNPHAARLAKQAIADELNARDEHPELDMPMMPEWLAVKYRGRYHASTVPLECRMVNQPTAPMVVYREAD